ncbi:hypothetical protein [Luteimonas fraxinea]|uniref:hypothetical protein n=1 Tax=Luteimonas fraxinea TaxID=2901869 RepID=UPI001E5172D0|nr:hypothetical protein [Luteimonas fraxinea]MCD9127656.1 hypothetical protein [Luteimonas fraxinea]
MSTDRMIKSTIGPLYLHLMCCCCVFFLTTQLGVASDRANEGWEERPGIHVFSNYGAEYVLESEDLSEAAVRAVIEDLDWVDGFHQVIVVRPSGESMEVGGSLQEEIGLAAVYRITPDKVTSVIHEAPETIEEIVGILLAFNQGGDLWRIRYDFR